MYNVPYHFPVCAVIIMEQSMAQPSYEVPLNVSCLFFELVC